MTKAIIIIGEENSGKSKLSKDLASDYSSEQVTLIDGKSMLNNSFPFQDVTKKTKVLIIDEIFKLDTLDRFLSIVAGNLIVTKKGEEIFEIKLEKLIIVCCSRIKKSNFPTYASFTRRFEVLDAKDFLMKK